ncbi:MAG: SGNH/GDSL hydrolase family protein [Bacilli bacterium]
MKKVFLILVLFLSCYFIYNITIDKKIFYLTIGDFLSRGINEFGVVSYGYNDYIRDYLNSSNKLKEYNKVFTDNDYQVEDILRILEYNEKKEGYSLNRLIKEADIITISLGMNEIYYKINKGNQNTYTYIDKMINNYNTILTYVNKFHHDKVYVLGYYNSLGREEDIFNYANYKLKEICTKQNVIYVDLSQILDNNPKYLPKLPNFNPNIAGYEKISQIIVENLKNN